jgi:hypothetical protein
MLRQNGQGAGMAKIIQFPGIHARASSTILKPKTFGAASIPIARSASVISMKLSGGISPRTRQLTTAGGPTAAIAAVLVGPPSASITDSTEVSIAPFSSRNVKMSSLHTKGVDFTPCELPKWGMPESNKSLANRLKITREAIGVIPADVCKRLKVGANAWSQYESGERRITIGVAIRFCSEYGLTLDWIYRADPSRLPHEIRVKLPPTAA